MRLLWISCLLIGSITCRPYEKAAPPSMWQYVSGGPGSSDQSASSHDSGVSIGPGSSSEYSSRLGGGDRAYGGPHVGQYAVQGSSSDRVVVDNEPVSSDVSDLDQVYFGSRSRYWRGNAWF